VHEVQIDIEQRRFTERLDGVFFQIFSKSPAGWHLANSHDLEAKNSGGASYSTSSPTECPSKALPNVTWGGDEHAVGLFFDRPDEELLSIVVAVALVDDLDDGGVFDRVGVLVALNDLVITDHVVDLRMRDSILPWASLAAW